MAVDSLRILRRLGDGESVDSVCGSVGISLEEFNAWWDAEQKRRLSRLHGCTQASVGAAAQIHRDGHGIPHIYADTEADLFVGYGYAMAQDRLFQMDYLRRRALGRVSEIMGPEAFEYDLLVRTVGLHAIAEREVVQLPAETVSFYEAFAQGVNCAMEDHHDQPPIEFDLLGYRPEPWRPVDSIALLGELRWYLTGRFPVIAVPEMAKRALGAGQLYEAFTTPEAASETILLSGEYESRTGDSSPPHESMGGLDDTTGSNNWVIGPSRSASGAPILASDPHIAFGAPGCWYQAHLIGGRFNVAGAGYAGAPGIIFGRNEHVAWGITNNISSQRDLYLERTDPGHPDAFLYDGQWEPARKRVERIVVRGGRTQEEVIWSSRNGPIVDRVLPAFARHTGPVSLRWAGAMPCAWPTVLLRSSTAESCVDLESSLDGWVVPTLSMVFADVDGRFGFRATGEVPLRQSNTRGYRRGWDPADAWEGMIPFSGMPSVREPERGWIASANNLPAPPDYPYPLANMSPSGQRARRIRQLVESCQTISRQDVQSMQYDALSLRAVEAIPSLVSILRDGDAHLRSAADILDDWDCRMDVDRPAATLFEEFQHSWNTTVAIERFSADARAMAIGDAAAFVAGGIGSLSLRLLAADDVGWFPSTAARDDAVRAAMAAAIAALAERLGGNMSTWTWGRVHTLHLRHVLSDRGDLGALLDRGGQPVGGNGFVVSNTGSSSSHAADGGANFRLVVDLAECPAQLWSLDVAGQSGQPGSPNYVDQTTDWLEGRYHRTPLERDEVVAATVSVLTLEPEEDRCGPNT